MSATNGNKTGNHAAVADARPLVLLRYRPGVVGETARTVHMAPLPVDHTSAVSALCSTLLPLDQVETVNPGHGMPCMTCVLNHVLIGPPPPEDPTAGHTANHTPEGY